jgi:hypothetical protein
LISLKIKAIDDTMNKLIRRSFLINFYLLKYMNILKIKKYTKLENHRIKYTRIYKKGTCSQTKNKRLDQQKNIDNQSENKLG